MKFPLTILILGLRYGMVFGQAFPIGNFFSESGNTGLQTEFFQFNTDQTFKYEMLAHGENISGAGTYSSSNDTLRLRFTSHLEDREWTIVHSKKGSGTKTTIDITVELCESNSGLPDLVQVYTKKIKHGTVIDGNGAAQLFIDKIPGGDTLVVKSPNHKPIYIPIKDDYKYLSVNVKLQRLFMNRNGNTEVYKITGSNKNSFGISQLNGFNMKYQRITKDSSETSIKAWDDGRRYDQFLTTTMDSVTKDDIDRFLHFLVRENVIKSTKTINAEPLRISPQEIFNALDVRSGNKKTLSDSVKNGVLAMTQQYESFANFRFQPKGYYLKEAASDTYTAISLPYFNKRKDIVIIQVSDICPGLCGTDHVALFQRKRGKWREQISAMRFH